VRRNACAAAAILAVISLGLLNNCSIEIGRRQGNCGGLWTGRMKMPEPTHAVQLRLF